MRVQGRSAGLHSTYGVSLGKMFYEPAEGGLAPREETWSTRPYLRSIGDVFSAVRERFGYELELLHDAHHRLSPIEAAQLGRLLEPHQLFWLEDPVPAELQASLRVIRRHTTTPIAIGEVFNSIWDCEQLLREQLIDYLRMSVVHSGGITRLGFFLHLAELYRVRSGFHGATDLSRVHGRGAGARHGDSELRPARVHAPHPGDRRGVPPRVHLRRRLPVPGDQPGLGVDIDEKLAARHPYRPALLPVARLPDGTMHDW